jgi:hypothetical protein
MRPTSALPVLLFLAAPLLALSGCPVKEGALDTSGLGVAAWQQPYSGQLAVADYRGPARFTLVGGDLPEGLDFDEAGRVTGTPTWAGTYEIDILVTDMRRIEDFAETASLRVSAADEPGVFIHYEHDQINNMTGEYGLMTDPWVRVSGGGEPGKDSYTIKPGVYLPGEDGLPDEGMGDDERIGDLPWDELDLTFSDWEPTGPQDPFPPGGYPSGHYPCDEDEPCPPSIEDDGTVRSDEDTGEAALSFSHPEYPGVVNTRILVVPPDWCPNGVDATGGPGGPSATRYCE